MAHRSTHPLERCSDHAHMPGSTCARPTVLAFAVVGGLAIAACGNATESGVEELVESQADGDIELDLDDKGGLSVQTEDGGMSIDDHRRGQRGVRRQ
jgi:hypothetical protein